MLDKITLWNHLGLGISKFSFFHGFKTSEVKKVIFLILAEFWYFVGLRNDSIVIREQILCDFSFKKFAYISIFVLLFLFLIPLFFFSWLPFNYLSIF